MTTTHILKPKMVSRVRDRFWNRLKYVCTYTKLPVEFLLRYWYSLSLAKWVECSPMVPGDLGSIPGDLGSTPGDLGSTPGRVIPKNFKMVLDSSLLNTQQYRYVLRVKWSDSGKGVTPWCSSYWKGSFRVALDYGHQPYLLTRVKVKI